MASHDELHSYLKQAVLELEKTRERLREFEAKSREPIAIVGMACRYPGGVNSPADLWHAVIEGRDLMSDLPADRGWDIDDMHDPATPMGGRSGAQFGGFVSDVTGFDADFFAISSDEALAMDPQQRLVLEATWEAFERAGIDPLTALGSDTGVFLGVASAQGDPISSATAIGEPVGRLSFVTTSRVSSMAAGRISYFFGFSGPAIAVDTACSSSLVAIHHAVRSLRSGECPLALAGGVTVLTEHGFAGLVRGMGCAADGRCKSFAAAADGAGWGEGAGVLLLERLSDALDNQHPVLAVIRGSAVNHDGQSNGPEAPNRLAQQQVIRRALADAGLDGAQVDVVEAHSTGTPLGDLTEVEALSEMYGKRRPEGRPLWLGSVKSNMGHTAAAAGVGGVIKMVEALRHKVVPPTLHVDEPAPYFDWSTAGVQLAKNAQPWPQGDDVRRAGVSSFGISGVNAHVIVEEAAEESLTAGETPVKFGDTSVGVVSWVITAKSAEALSSQGARLVAHLERNSDFRSIDIGLSLASGRAKFHHRAVIIGRNRDQLLNGVRSLATGGNSSSVVRGVSATRPKTAVLFPGEGAQFAGMGSQLYALFPVYAAAFDEVCSIFDQRLSASLRDVVFAEAGSEAAELLNQPIYEQPALFAVQVALFRLAESWGLRPEFVVGHSLGEVTAAYVAGLWSLPDACLVVAERGRLTQSIPAGGGMLSVEATPGDVTPYLAELSGCAIAAINGPALLTISGEVSTLNALAEKLGGDNIPTKRLAVSHALNSSHMDPILAEFSRVCQRLTYHEPTIRVISGVAGKTVDAGMLSSPEYWVDQLKMPVRFMEAMHWARLQEGVSNFLEIGPGAGLVALTNSNFGGAEASSHSIAAATLLQPSLDENASFVGGLATMYVCGTPIDWARSYQDSAARQVELPTYAFQRKRLWPDPAAVRNASTTGLSGAQPSATTGPVRSSGEPPCTETEQTLARAIEAVLGVADVGREVQFLALGGDSVSALQLALRVRAAGLPLTPQMIFDHPTLRQLAAALDEAAPDAENESDGAIGVVGEARSQAMSMSGLSSAELAALSGVLAKIDGVA
ncbi:Phenolphthiocerol synthesis polyketide synthase type I Pks15/1 [Mycobacterium simulans]|uniref:Phenolphthiocerol synthesis polyketide synthase type I Pks15/1 n=1 Tax=Mycobacterium simulans TaxID=627089 RepID=A0A7Z7NAU7_9MYCO|nr:type I polyketide synthase [Mycobacterium simulans]SOJ55238.1 Phenolphthiocerol synthesis polyketide synthase type I Pks15/1 [Mycobacterium simulans]